MVAVGLLSGVSVLTLDGLTGSQRNVAATRLRSTVAFAQAWAMGTHNDTWVVVDVGANLVSLHVEDPASPGPLGRLPLRDPLTGGDLVLVPGAGAAALASVDFGGTDELWFDPTGTPSDADGVPLAGDGTIDIAGGVTVRVTPTTGRVSVDP